MSYQTAISAVTNLKRGGKVLILREKEQLVGKILTASLTQLGLQLAETPASEFQVNERLTLQYSGNTETLYSWDARIDKVTGYGKQVLASILSGEILGRKYQRFQIPIDILTTIVESQEKDLKGRQVRFQTENISTNGLLFETTLTLSVGDKLEMNIKSGVDEVNARGWIVRSERVTRNVYETGTIRKSFFSIGVEFLNLSQENHLRLLKIFLQARAESSR